MGAFKDHALAGVPFAQRGGAAAWLDVSPRHPCPVCSAQSWCQVNREGTVVLCKRTSSARKRLNREGVEFFVHTFGASSWRELAPALYTTHERADVATLDAAYNAVLSRLTLDPADRDALIARGLDAETIRAADYRTMPDRRRAELARIVVDEVSEHVAPTVPGIVKRTEGSREWWSFGGPSGLVVPLRDMDGRVFALKVRRRDPCEGQRYLYVTSSRHDGPSALSALHIPVAAREMGLARGFTITEGELKADVSTHLWKRPVVSVPGVGVWRPAVDLARAVGAERVAVAFDMDADTNPKVARPRAELVAALRAAGITPRLLTWDRRFKGLDDFLAARARGEVSSAR